MVRFVILTLVLASCSCSEGIFLAESASTVSEKTTFHGFSTSEGYPTALTITDEDYLIVTTQSSDDTVASLLPNSMSGVQSTLSVAPAGRPVVALPKDVSLGMAIGGNFVAENRDADGTTTNIQLTEAVPCTTLAISKNDDIYCFEDGKLANAAESTKTETGYPGITFSNFPSNDISAEIVDSNNNLILAWTTGSAFSIVSYTANLATQNFYSYFDANVTGNNTLTSLEITELSSGDFLVHGKTARGNCYFFTVSTSGAVSGNEYHLVGTLQCKKTFVNVAENMIYGISSDSKVSMISLSAPTTVTAVAYESYVSEEPVLVSGGAFSSGKIVIMGYLPKSDSTETDGYFFIMTDKSATMTQDKASKFVLASKDGIAESVSEVAITVETTGANILTTTSGEIAYTETSGVLGGQRASFPTGTDILGRAIPQSRSGTLEVHMKNYQSTQLDASDFSLKSLQGCVASLLSTPEWLTIEGYELKTTTFPEEYESQSFSTDMTLTCYGYFEATSEFSLSYGESASLTTLSSLAFILMMIFSQHCSCT